MSGHRKRCGASGLSKPTLDCYLDLGNLAGLLALPGIKTLAAETHVEIQMYPIQGIVPRPLSPEPKAKPDDPLADFKHLRWQAKHQHEIAELNRDCARLDLDESIARHSYDASLTHRAWLFLQANYPEKVLAYVELIYDLRFKQGVSLVESEQLNSALASLGIDSTQFFDQQDHWQGIWDKHVEGYLTLGIHDSPAFVLAGETFQGRQHFPLIRWRLSGEPGSPPV